MTLRLTSKAIVGVGLTGIATGAGVVGYFYFKKPEQIEIEKLIEKEHKGKSILDNSNKQKGVEVWNKYNSDNTNKEANQDAWKITGWPVAQPETKKEAPEGLINACQTKKKEKVKDNKDQTYLSFVKWCLVSNS